MPPDPELTDGVLPTGSFDIAILELGESFVADNFQADTDSVAVRRKTARGRPGAQKFIEAFTDGSCDLQLATRSAKRPKPGMTFVADEDGDGTAEPWVITKPGKAFTQDGETKLKCGIARAVAPVIYAASGKTTAELYAGVTYASGGAITTLGLEAHLPADLALVANSWAATGLPAGLSISAANGDITGTPTTPGTNYVRVTVQGKRSIVANGALVEETITGVREFIITIT